jgi:hypothetical protein
MSDENVSNTPGPSHVDTQSPDGAVMSTPETLGNIFFDPAATFESLERKPRFLTAGLILIILSLGVTMLLFQKVDFEEFMRQQFENNPKTAQMTPEQKEQAIRMQSGTVGKTIAHVAPVFVLVVIFAAGAGLYLLGTLAMGGRMNYKQSLAVWVYSSFPPGILAGVVGIVVLLAKPADSIDLSHPESIAQANLGMLVGASSSPVLYALLSSLDLFQFYGLFLGALGLKKVGRLSSGSAWTIVLGLYVLKTVLRVGWAAAFGR